MTYATLLVTMALDGSNEPILRVATGLAQRLKCSVIGIAVCQPVQIMYGDGYLDGDVIEQDRAQKMDSIEKAEVQFRSTLGPCVPILHWRSSIGYALLADTIAENARAADPLLISPAHRKSIMDPSSQIDAGALVIQLGRPTPVVPHDTKTLALQHIMIAWKDTLETRRAIVDSLPLLRLADRVTVAQIAEEADIQAARGRLLDVAEWLGRHGVAAQTVVAPSTDDDAAGLNGIALEHAATFLVAGAYGHGRLREWAHGGVTRDLLAQPARCTLLSH
jgi:nucleotide-binding universal stress UspA family protein